RRCRTPGQNRTQHPCTPAKADLAPMYSLGRRYWHPTIGRFSTRVLLLPPEVCPILSAVGNDCPRAAGEYKDEKYSALVGCDCSEYGVVCGSLGVACRAAASRQKRRTKRQNHRTEKQK